MFTRTRKNVRNKEYASLFMKVQEVHRVIGGSLSLFLVISMNSFILKNLGSKRSVCEGCVAHTITEEEEEGTAGSHRWFSRTKSSTIPRIPFVRFFNMLNRR